MNSAKLLFTLALTASALPQAQAAEVRARDALTLYHLTPPEDR